MDNNKQKLLLEYLVSSPDTYALCSSIVQPDYFDPELRNAVTFIHQYYDEYHNIPSIDQVRAETGVELNTHHVTRDQLDYTTNEIEKFCKHRAMEKAVLDAAKILTSKDETKDFGKIENLIRSAVTVSLNRNLGTDFFKNPEERLRLYKEEGPKISTGWKEVDDLLYGGVERGELIVFSANSGGGKSVALANYALNLIEQGLHAVYFSFELSEKLIVQRFNTMISGISSAVWQYHIDEIARSVLQLGDRSGTLIIKQMHSGTTPNQLRAYLKEYELVYRRTPDVVICDYLDIMNPNERVSADNVFEKDKRVSEQIRDIGIDYKAIIASASQQNRGAVDQTYINQGHVAGGISKVNTSDIWISILANPTQKAAGECAFQFLKTRNSDGHGKTIQLEWTKNIRIRDPQKDTKLNLKKKEKAEKSPWLEEPSDTGTNNSLIDMFEV